VNTNELAPERIDGIGGYHPSSSTALVVGVDKSIEQQFSTWEKIS